MTFSRPGGGGLPAEQAYAASLQLRPADVRALPERGVVAAWWASVFLWLCYLLLTLSSKTQVKQKKADPILIIKT